MDALPVQSQILPRNIIRCNHNESIDADERIGIQFHRRRSIPNVVIRC